MGHQLKNMQFVCVNVCISQHKINEKIKQKLDYIMYDIKVNCETTKLINIVFAVAGIITYEITAQVDFVCVIYCATATLLHIHALESCCNHAEVKHEIIIIAIAAIPAAVAAAAAAAAATAATTTTISTLHWVLVL
uniref:Uncharacterized protein n=1 Tax=Glossina palpalis gambiensis TaxID=67801 RepID=A0A1B0AZ18_9MUSC